MDHLCPFLEYRRYWMNDCRASITCAFSVELCFLLYVLRRLLSERENKDMH